MRTITISLPKELEKEMEELPENWSKVASDAIKLRILRGKLESKEEKELSKWSVELGRKAKKGRFKRLLAELSPERRKEVLSALSPEQRRKALE